MDFSFAVLSRADRWHSYRHTPASLSLSLSLSRSLSLSLSLSLAHTYPHKRTHRRLVRRSLICSLARRLVRSAPDAWARQKEEVCLVSIAIPTQGRQLEQTRSELGAWEACHTHSCKRSSACSAHTHTHKHAHIHTHKHTHTHKMGSPIRVLFDTQLHTWRLECWLPHMLVTTVLLLHYASTPADLRYTHFHTAEGRPIFICC